VLYGMFGEITVGELHFNSQMPDFGRLDDATLAAAERAHAMDGAAVREHRKSLAAAGS